MKKLIIAMFVMLAFPVGSYASVSVQDSITKPMFETVLEVGWEYTRDINTDEYENLKEQLEEECFDLRDQYYAHRQIVSSNLGVIIDGKYYGRLTSLNLKYRDLDRECKIAVTEITTYINDYEGAEEENEVGAILQSQEERIAELMNMIMFLQAQIAQLEAAQSL